MFGSHGLSLEPWHSLSSNIEFPGITFKFNSCPFQTRIKTHADKPHKSFFLTVSEEEKYPEQEQARRPQDGKLLTISER